MIKQLQELRCDLSRVQKCVTKPSFGPAGAYQASVYRGPPANLCELEEEEVVANVQAGPWQLNPGWQGMGANGAGQPWQQVGGRTPGVIQQGCDEDATDVVIQTISLAHVLGRHARSMGKEDIACNGVHTICWPGKICQ